MFQWDAVDTSPDLWGQNVLKTFEMAIRHNRLTRRTELGRVFLSLDLFSLTFKNIFLALLRGAIALVAPPIHRLMMRRAFDVL